MLVDSNGVLVATVVVTPADVQDRAALSVLLRNAKQIAPTIAHDWVDKGHTGQTVTTAAARADVTVDMVSGPKPAHGFIVQSRHWVIERTNGRINHRQHIDRHNEVTLQAHEGIRYLSQIALLLRRLDRSQ